MHLQFSLPVPVRYISVSGNGSGEAFKQWSDDITMACSICGQDRSAAQKRKLSKTFTAICDRYTTVVKQSNAVRSHRHDVDSSENICRQWYALLDLMVLESYLPLHHYCFYIVRTSLRNFQEDDMMLLLSMQNQSQSHKQREERRRKAARGSAELIVNWRALLECMCVCYPPEVIKNDGSHVVCYHQCNKQYYICYEMYK